jgi:hypothetical protein
VPGELNISKSFGILSSVKLSNKSHDFLPLLIFWLSVFFLADLLK